jgi:hypothetical protein
MKNVVFWDVTPCGSSKNRHFGKCIASFIRVTKIGQLGTALAVTSRRCKLPVTSFLCSLLRLLIYANVFPSSPILVTLIMEAIRSSETPVLTRATLSFYIPVDILHSHRREKLKSYIALTGWAVYLRHASIILGPILGK